MDAIVLAGGIPKPEEPLYIYTQGKPKAFLEIAKKPMLQWVLDALGAASQVRRVIVVGLEDGIGFTCAKPMIFCPNQGSMLDNIIYGLRQVQSQETISERILLVTSDIPGVKAEMLDWVINNALKTNFDLYYHLIPQEVMEKRYPGSRRTYTRLKDVVVCGGDVIILATRVLKTKRENWERLIGSRKSPLRQAAIIGFDTLLLLLFHAITLDGAVKKVTKRLGITGRAVLCPYAEVGMDVDKPHQLELMRADLAG